MNDDELIGKKMIAFPFHGAPGYTSSMRMIEGKIGKITRKSDTYCAVNFRGIGSWNYPYPELLEHLVEKEEQEIDINKIFEQIKQLTP